MNRRFFWLLVWVLLVGLVPYRVSAQLSFNARLNTSRALLYEPVLLTLELRNETGRPVTLGDGTGPMLSIDVESSPGRYMRQIAPHLLEEPLLLPPRTTVKHIINLTEAFQIRQTTPYTVRAYVTWDDVSFGSGVMFLDVVPGLELLRRRGPASADGAGRRLYRVVSLFRDRSEHAFLQIDDEQAGVCYGVIHLGRLVRLQPPKLEIDDEANVHVLHQAGPTQFLLHVYTPNGDRVLRKLYSAEGTQVDLVPEDDGQIRVSGAFSSRSD